MRVPTRFRHVEPRAEVWISLGTSDPKEAIVQEIKAKAAQVAEWEALAGVGGTSEDRFQRATTLAVARGFTYRSASEIASEETLEEVLARAEALAPDPNMPVDQAVAAIRPEIAAAVLGGVEKPPIMLSGLLAYIERLEDVQTDNRFKSNEQMRLWRNPRLRAIANLRKALAAADRPDDLPVEEITHAIARLHHAAWKRRIRDGKVSTETAEKDYSNMSSMLRFYWDSVGKQYPKPYGGLSHRDRFAAQNRKPEFSTEWIEKNIAHPGCMEGLNDEARAIVQIVAETGCRQSEIYNLPPSGIVLDAPIPYIEIEPVDDEQLKREIKNIHSKRKMPLVGIALDAARRHPNGFPRYRGNSSFSQTVNKWFRENGLFPTKKHTIGGLRHSWESRLSALGLRSDEVGELMGHSVKRIRRREVYGDEKALEMKEAAALLIGFGPLVEEEQRHALVSKLRKLLDEWREI